MKGRELSAFVAPESTSRFSIAKSSIDIAAGDCCGEFFRISGHTTPPDVAEGGQWLVVETGGSRSEEQQTPWAH